MTETANGGPAVFDCVQDAFKAADDENTGEGGIHENGFSVEVYKLASGLQPAKRPAKAKTPRKSRGAE